MEVTAETLSTQRKPAALRALLGFAAIAALAVIPSPSRGQNATPANDGANGGASSSAASSSQDQSAGTSAAAPQGDSLAAASRKAKEQKSQPAKPAKVFTNDNLPSGGISTVGVTSSAVPTDGSAAAAPSSGQGEKYWRDKFASLNKKLEQDQTEVDVMQRELGQLNLQNYGDPVQAMQQGYSRSDIDKKTTEIDAKQKAVEADKQAISDAEDDLRRAGGDPGWGR
jgi:hypothetical protein